MDGTTIVPVSEIPWFEFNCRKYFVTQSGSWWHSGQIKQSEVIYAHRAKEIASVSEVLRWRRIQISDLKNIINSN